MKSKAGYWWGGGLMLAGCAIGAVAVMALMVLMLGQGLRGADAFHELAVPGHDTLDLDAREYLVCDSDAGSDAGAVTVRVFDSTTHAEMPVRPSLNGECAGWGATRFRVTPPRAGSYDVVTSGDGGSLVFGDEAGNQYYAPLSWGLLGGVLVMMAGFALLVATSIRRSRVRGVQPVYPGGTPGNRPGGDPSWGPQRR